jgi:sterol desaturase/sphingolipid hydroxylase (fatty acid hydroxylase superfamily)
VHFQAIWNFLYTSAAEEIRVLALSVGLFAGAGLLLFFWHNRGRLRASAKGLPHFLFPIGRYRPEQLRLELWMLLTSRLLWYPIISMIGLLFISVDLKRMLDQQFGAMPTAISGMPLLIAQFLVSYLALEFAGYWGHRFLHTRGFLWSIHRVHHSAEVLTFLGSGPINHLRG